MHILRSMLIRIAMVIKKLVVPLTLEFILKKIIIILSRKKQLATKRQPYLAANSKGPVPVFLEEWVSVNSTVSDCIYDFISKICTDKHFHS